MASSEAPNEAQIGTVPRTYSWNPPDNNRPERVRHIASGVSDLFSSVTDVFAHHFRVGSATCGPTMSITTWLISPMVSPELTSNATESLEYASPYLPQSETRIHRFSSREIDGWCTARGPIVCQNAVGSAVLPGSDGVAQAPDPASAAGRAFFLMDLTLDSVD